MRPSLVVIAPPALDGDARAFFGRATKRTLPAPTDPMLQERLDRLEGAIQAIAIETERIAEGQRFTTKLLSQNGSPQHGAPTVQPSGIALPSYGEEPISGARASQRSAIR